MDAKPLAGEQWREYDFSDRQYRIVDPVSLFVGETTHRVLDSTGVVHCVPKPGLSGCVLRWLPKNAVDPCQF